MEQVLDLPLNRLNLYYDKILDLLNGILSELEVEIGKNIQNEDNEIAEVHSILLSCVSRINTCKGDMDNFEVDEIRHCFSNLNSTSAEIIQKRYYRENLLDIYDLFKDESFAELDFNGGINTDFKIVQVDYSGFKEVDYVSYSNMKLFSKGGFNELIQELNTDHTLLFYLLEQITTIDFANSAYYCLLKSDINDNDIIYYLNLKQLSEGEIIYPQLENRRELSIQANMNWDSTTSYKQFNDIMLILNEYNSTNNILYQFLNMYQIFENLVYRSNICELVNINEDMFSIRNFKILYERVSKSELASIKNFLSKALKTEYKDGNYFWQFIEKKWNQDFILHKEKSDIENALMSIGVEGTIGSANFKQTSSFISKLIYQMRNSIVHNKETEFHITIHVLSKEPIYKQLLLEFLLPILDELVFSLIVNKETIVTYNKESLSLF